MWKSLRPIGLSPWILIACLLLPAAGLAQADPPNDPLTQGIRELLRKQQSGTPLSSEAYLTAVIALIDKEGDPNDPTTALYRDAYQLMLEGVTAADYRSLERNLAQAQAKFETVATDHPPDTTNVTLALQEARTILASIEMVTIMRELLREKIEEEEARIAEHQREIERELRRARREVASDPCYADPKADCLVGEIRRLAMGLTEPRARADMLVRLADVQIAMGLRKQAASGLSLALGSLLGLPEVDSENSSDYGMARPVEIAERFARAGDLSLALQTVDDMEEDDDRPGALRRIASAFAETGQLEDARAVIDRMTAPFDKAVAHIEIAGHLAESGAKPKARVELARAEGLIEEVEKPGLRSFVLLELGNTLADLDRDGEAVQALREAVEIVERIDEPHLRTMHFTTLASTFNEIGDRQAGEDFIARALTAFGQIEDEDYRLYRVVPLAISLNEMGKLGQARGILKTYLRSLYATPDWHKNVWELGIVAQTQREIGVPAEARQTLMELRREAEGITDTWHRQYALTRLSRSQMTAGFLDDAISTMELRRKLAFRDKDEIDVMATYRDLAEVEACRGNFDAAMDLARRLDSRTRQWLYSDLMQYHLHGGNHGQAIEMACLIEDENDRALALLSIAGSLAGMKKTPPYISKIFEWGGCSL